MRLQERQKQMEVRLQEGQRRMSKSQTNNGYYNMLYRYSSGQLNIGGTQSTLDRAIILFVPCPHPSLTNTTRMSRTQQLHPLPV